MAEAYWARGEMFKKKRDPDRAIADYTEAIRLCPTDQRAYIGRADAYEGKGDVQHSRLDHAEERCLLALELAEKGDLKGAETCWKGAIYFNPNNAKAYYQRGLIRAKRGNAAGAAEDFAAAARLDPKYAPAPSAAK